MNDDENHPLEKIRQSIEALGRQTLELPSNLWCGICSVDVPAVDEPCEFPHPYRFDAAHADSWRPYSGGEVDDGRSDIRFAGCCGRKGSGDKPFAWLG